LSSNEIEPADSLVAPEEPRPTSAGHLPRGVRPAVAMAAPAVAALLALSFHQLFQDQQAPPMSWMDHLPGWQHPYPLFLGVVLAGSLCCAAGQLVWPPLRRWSLHYGPLLAGFVGALCIWNLITVKWGWMPYPFFPGPDEVLGALIDDRGVLFESTWHSLRLLLSGYLAGVAAGLVTGVLIGWFPTLRYWGMPVMKVVGPIPATALVPLVMTLFPAALSFFSGAALIAFAVWFPMTMLTSSGIANVRLSYLDVARTLGAGRLYLIFRVAIPAAMPNIFLGLFMGLSASFLTLIVAETIGVKAGLGWYLQWQKGYAEYGKVYASLIIMAVFFSTLMTLLFKIRDQVLKWQKGVIRW
jgi:NitT/TauT family transport system permease protein